ncbi:MAG: DMT family transporter [Clostridia bacterium]|nr:DMT family transporter [Clostridia bacterium]
MTTKQQKAFGLFLLFAAAVVWGFAFPMQSAAAEHVGSFTLNCCRSLLGGAFLVLCILVLDKKKERRLFSRKAPHIDVTKREWIGGILCGVVLCFAINFQQLGIAGEATDSGKAAFITALYVVLVPLFNLFAGKRPRPAVWLCIVFALLGFYLLSAPIVVEEAGLLGFLRALGKSGFRFATSDILVFICAVIFSVHVIVIDLFAEGTDGVRISCIQFFTAGILSLPLMIFLDKPALSDIMAAALPILYLAILSSGIGYTAQIVGQKYVDVAIAPMVLSLESVFGAIGGALLLQETKTAVQIVGCVIVFGAVILVQLPARKKKEKKGESQENRE